MPIDKALERAQAKALDLVEVAPDAQPPVCRIMDFTKYLYEQKRKQKLARKKTARVDTKEVKLRPNIDPHDFGIKLNHSREFLEKGNKVKFTIRYRPREMRHYEIGLKVMDRLVEELKELASVESTTRNQSGLRMQTMILAPRKEAIARRDHEEGEAAEN
ncbi:MAG: Translation initiation factor IF-3 [candidate division BRC1 bacterium ADurb.BinA292]|nr:MAG: Translation initiation factor IF-3 [candidate division BRC1 bacterium ADurb.BinA292]